MFKEIEGTTDYMINVIIESIEMLNSSMGLIAIFFTILLIFSFFILNELIRIKKNTNEMKEYIKHIAYKNEKL